MSAPAEVRTYGTYRYLSPAELETRIGDFLSARYSRNGAWAIKATPAVAMRLKRVFTRATSSIAGQVMVGHSQEVCQDLEWFGQRYPLAAADQASADLLAASAGAFRQREQQIGELVSGMYQPTLLFAANVQARPYQQTAVDMLRLNGALLLGDEVGLGKTTTAMLNALHGDALPMVVVGPTHLVAQGGRWTDELDQHFPHLRYHVVKKGRVYDVADKATGQQPDVLLITYSKLRGWADWIEEWAKYAVFDEVHELRKGDTTEKGRAAGQIARAMRYTLGMSATPVFNYAGEVHSILTLISDGGVLGTRDEFLREWSSTSWNGNIRVADPAALGSYLREQGLLLARTRKEVGRELPKTIKVTEVCETDPKALEAVAGDAAALAQLVMSGSREERFESSGQLDMLMRQATGLAKAPFVAEFCRLLLESEQKIVLFGWHRAVYDVWLQNLAEFKPVLYSGSETPNQKVAAIKAFTEGDSRVLIMSVRSGSGVDGLQMVSKVAVFGELDWSPQQHEQAIGRLRRDGIDEPPVAYFMVANEGSDPLIAQVLQVKRQQGEQVMSPDGKLFENAVADVNRTKALARAVLDRAAGRLPAAAA